MKPAVNTAQTTWELEQLVSLVADLNPVRILEIGVYEGGTLWHWLDLADTAAIDDAMRDPGPHVWQEWADDAGTNLWLVQGSSHDADVIGSAHELGPFDFVFIDADHTYNAVKQDWENYAIAVKYGGLLAFHDIVERPGYGVSQLWNEIKQEPGTRWMEIVETVPADEETKHGIGVVWM